MKALSEDESALISKYYSADVKTVPVFRRLNIKGEVFFCQEYTHTKRRNSYTIMYKPAQYCQILYFTLLSDKGAFTNHFSDS